MLSTNIATVVKMLECLPEQTQGQAVEHLRQYLEELRDEFQWDDLFRQTQTQLASAAKRAKEEISAGKAAPLNYEHL